MWISSYVAFILSAVLITYELVFSFILQFTSLGVFSLISACYVEIRLLLRKIVTESWVSFSDVLLSCGVILLNTGWFMMPETTLIKSMDALLFLGAFVKEKYIHYSQPLLLLLDWVTVHLKTTFCSFMLCCPSFFLPSLALLFGPWFNFVFSLILNWNKFWIFVQLFRVGVYDVIGMLCLP